MCHCEAGPIKNFPADTDEFPHHSAGAGSNSELGIGVEEAVLSNK
jgi:hypothetical protein